MYMGTVALLEVQNIWWAQMNDTAIGDATFYVLRAFFFFW